MADSSYSITQTRLPEILERISGRGIMKAGDIDTSIKVNDPSAHEIDYFPKFFASCAVNLHFIEVESGNKSLPIEY